MSPLHRIAFGSNRPLRAGTGFQKSSAESQPRERNNPGCASPLPPRGQRASLNHPVLGFALLRTLSLNRIGAANNPPSLKKTIMTAFEIDSLAVAALQESLAASRRFVLCN